MHCLYVLTLLTLPMTHTPKLLDSHRNDIRTPAKQHSYLDLSFAMTNFLKPWRFALLTCLLSGTQTTGFCKIKTLYQPSLQPTNHAACTAVCMQHSPCDIQQCSSSLPAASSSRLPLLVAATHRRALAAPAGPSQPTGGWPTWIH